MKRKVTRDGKKLRKYYMRIIEEYFLYMSYNDDTHMKEILGNSIFDTLNVIADSFKRIFDDNKDNAHDDNVDEIRYHVALNLANKFNESNTLFKDFGGDLISKEDLIDFFDLGMCINELIKEQNEKAKEESNKEEVTTPTT